MNKRINRIILLLFCLLIICFLTKQVCASDQLLAILFLPGLMWGSLFFAFNFSFLKDKTFAGLGFITTSMLLLPIMMLIGGTVGMMLTIIHYLLALLFLGGLAAYFSYCFLHIF